MGRPEKGQSIAKINKNPHDCRKSNLLFVRNIEKAFNSRTTKKNPSGVRGVSWSKITEKWHVYLARGGTRYHGGFFEDLSEAIAARRKLEKQYCGDLKWYYVSGEDKNSEA